MEIEVEIRSFVSREQYEQLIDFLNKNAKKVKEDYQETFYFDCREDLRIQRNNFYSKIWLKKGRIHDEKREEIEIRFQRDDFERLENLFLSLGYKVEIKWFRNRQEFVWQDVNLCLDYTRGYGYIIELERMCSEANKEKELKRLKKMLRSLKIGFTPRDEFERKYNYYKENWRKLVGN